MNWRSILQQIPYHHLEDRANGILDQFTILSPEDLNLRKVARELGISVYYRPENSSAMRFGSKYLIVVDERLPLEERREKLAEEICHCLLPMGNQLLQKEWETNKQEDMAIRMAAYLLIPRKFLLQLKPPCEETLLLEYYSDYFNVSQSMIRYRYELDYRQWLMYGKREKYQAKNPSFKVAEHNSNYEMTDTDD